MSIFEYIQRRIKNLLPRSGFSWRYTNYSHELRFSRPSEEHSDLYEQLWLTQYGDSLEYIGSRSVISAVSCPEPFNELMFERYHYDICTTHHEFIEPDGEIVRDSYSELESQHDADEWLLSFEEFAIRDVVNLGHISGESLKKNTRLYRVHALQYFKDYLDHSCRTDVESKWLSKSSEIASLIVGSGTHYFESYMKAVLSIMLSTRAEINYNDAQRYLVKLDNSLDSRLTICILADLIYQHDIKGE